MSQAQTTCPRSEFSRTLTGVPTPVLLLRKMDQSPAPPMVGISKSGLCGALSEAKDMTLREERLKSTSLDPGFLSIFSLDELFRLFSPWT